MWETASILTELGWTELLMIPKGNVDTWGIRLI